jgi:uncharacterized protein YqeY
MAAGTPEDGSGDVAKARRLEAGPRSVNLLKRRLGGYPDRFPAAPETREMIRDAIKSAQIEAMKAGDKPRLAAVRLISSALKNRDIELRGAGGAPADDDALVIEVLQKMVKQRRESILLYEQGGRQELADAEKVEVEVIENFLPRQMSEDEAKAAIDAIVAETGASSLKDMGRVMAALKERHAGAMDMSKASGLVKARLG